MVTDLIKGWHNASQATRSPLVVELAGPAGAGKTTISQILGRIHKTVTIKVFPFVHQRVDRLFFAKQAILLTPDLVRLWVHKNGSRFLTPRELAWMAILNGWHRFLRQPTVGSHNVWLIDQGPIFLFSELYTNGPGVLNGKSAERWWERVFRAWSQTIDILVWLDASNEDLIQRIHLRDKWHRVKEKDELESIAYLNNIRSNYKKIITRLRDDGGHYRLIEIDTSKKTVDGILQKLISEFGA